MVLNVDFSRISCDCLSDPLYKFRHVGVDSVLPFLSTPFSKAGYSKYCPFGTFLVQKWSATVTRAGINTSLLETRAQHSVADVIPSVVLPALVQVHYWHFGLMQFICTVNSRVLSLAYLNKNIAM